MGDKFLLNTKIVSILMALVMIAGIGAIAADAAAPTATNCHQKVLILPAKDPKVWTDPCKTIVKDPFVWKAPCKQDPIVWKAPCKQDPIVWKAPCKQILLYGKLHVRLLSKTLLYGKLHVKKTQKFVKTQKYGNAIQHAKQLLQ